MSFFTTGFGQQRTASLSPGVATQVLCLGIAADAGYVVEATSVQEVTNQDTSNAFVWWELFLTQDPNAVTVFSTDFELSARVGTNITPGQHHFPIEAAGQCELPSKNQWTNPETDNWYVVLAMTWDSDLTIPGKVEQGNYGKLDANVVPPLA